MERAARIIYLNKTCYNGLFRVNSRGQINTPYGWRKNPRIFDEKLILSMSNYLNGDVEIRNGDYSLILDDLNDGSFVYLDPPYMPVSSTSFTSYTSNKFGYSEQVELRNFCYKLRDRGVKFIQSNSDTEEIHRLYSDFVIKVVPARRSINSKSSGRGSVNEVLICG